MEEDFTDKANKLFERINNISFYEKKELASDVTLGMSTRKISITKNNNSPVLPQTQTYMELVRAEQALAEN